MRNFWSETDLQYLTDNYPTMHTKMIAQALNRSERGIYSTAHLLGLKKDEKYLKENEFEKVAK